MRSEDDERAARLAAGRIIDRDELVSVLREYARARPEIQVIWLFGSQAEGAARRTSDLDLAFQVVPPPAAEDEIAYRAARARELEALLRVPVDAVLLSPALPVPLLWNILHTHTVVYEREPDQAATTGAFLRGVCRDEWPRLERRWERNRRELQKWAEDAPNRS
ncbi:MAG TPA: nucleotidyltransferase domain-containing protein [Armatimonadota bacterium]|nr:nucleotidyltransferase domain-containing protein [Armatimonadota bacterium]